MKLRSGEENSAKKPSFGNSWRLSIVSKKKFDCVQMPFYLEFLDTCYEETRKSEVPKMVIFGRKSIPLAHLHFSTDFKNFNGSETDRSIQ